MTDKNKMPEWYENFPFSKKIKKNPIVITKEMEIRFNYGKHGNDLFQRVFLSNPDLTVTDYVCPPGNYIIPPGFHCDEEIYYVLSGEAKVLNPENGKCIKAKAGDAIIIPKGTLHQVHNFCEENLYILSFVHKPWDEDEWKKLQKLSREN